MNYPLVDLKAEYMVLKQEIDKAIEEVLNSSSYILGPNVTRLERNIAEFIGVDYAVGVASGTDALILALEALGVGAGDEVITTPFTFFATAEAISRVGARPVFVDIDRKTYNIDPMLVEEKVGEKTKAILPVHIFGHPADMDPIMDVAEAYNLYVVEDACQAIGARYKGSRVGTFGDAACFSFFPTKNLGCYGDGGMILTNNSQLADQLKMLRSHGSRKKYYNSILGYNSRLDELQAAVLNVKLKYLDCWNIKRRELASRYNNLLGNCDVTKPFSDPNVEHVYHMYVLQAEERGQMVDYLVSNAIGTGIYYPLPLHLQDAYKDLGYRVGDLPVAESICERSFAIPLYPELSIIGQLLIIDKIKSFF